MVPVFKFPFSLIIASPSNGGKSTLTYNIIKHSKSLVDNTDGNGFDSVWVIYRSWQPLYEQMKQELSIPIYFFEKKLPDELATLLSQTSSRYPVVVVDDGLCPENQELVLDLFCRLGHHLSVSVILICQTLYDNKNPTLRLCHRNTKALIIFACPRDQSTLRTLVYQMLPTKKKAQSLLAAVEKELTAPYNYMLFDYHPQCPADQRYKTNILCERDPFPVCLQFV